MSMLLLRLKAQTYTNSLLVHGYCRELRDGKSDSIPKEILDLCFIHYLVLKPLKIGRKVTLKNDRKGIVKYIGTTEFSGNEKVVGLELDRWSPNCMFFDDENFTKYLSAGPGRRYFAPLNCIMIQKPSVPLHLQHILDEIWGNKKKEMWEGVDEYVIKDLDLVNIGDRVSTWMGCTGTVKFKGTTHFDGPRDLVGIELDRWSPNGNNGVIHGHLYFECKAGHGHFARIEHIFKFIDESTNPWSVTSV